MMRPAVLARLLFTAEARAAMGPMGERVGVLWATLMKGGAPRG